MDIHLFICPLKQTSVDTFVRTTNKSALIKREEEKDNQISSDAVKGINCQAK